MPNFYDNWQADEYDCRACKWHGLGSDLVAELDYFSWDFVPYNCPFCEDCVTIVNNPTLDESRANWDKLSGDERKRIENRERWLADFEVRGLKATDQLPDIESSEFVLHWDQDTHETLIKHNATVIFREPVTWEGYTRFIQVAKILRARYGTALRDLIPTSGSEMFLYGDQISSLKTVAEARDEIFPERPRPKPDLRSGWQRLRDFEEKCRREAESARS